MSNQKVKDRNQGCKPTTFTVCRRSQFCIVLLEKLSSAEIIRNKIRKVLIHNTTMIALENKNNTYK